MCCVVTVVYVSSRACQAVPPGVWVIYCMFAWVADDDYSDWWLGWLVGWIGLAMFVVALCGWLVLVWCVSIGICFRFFCFVESKSNFSYFSTLAKRLAWMKRKLKVNSLNWYHFILFIRLLFGRNFILIWCLLLET